MAKSVRLGNELEKLLDDYCVAHRMKASDVIRAGVFEFIQRKGEQKSASLWEIGKDLFGADETALDIGSVAANHKALLKMKLHEEHPSLMPGR